MNIESLTESLQRYRALTVGVEGWITELAVAASTVFLQAQNEAGHVGDLMEIGAWHGKSAMLWLAFAKPKEHTHVFDLEVRPELQSNLEKAKVTLDREVTVIKQNSFMLARTDFSERMRLKVRVAHIDGDHTAPAVWNDLAYCHPLLHPQGVIIVDDFLNSRFPQVTETVFEYLRQHTFDLSMVLVGGNKGFIVRSKFHYFWLELLRQTLEPAMAAAGVKHVSHDGTLQNRACLCIQAR